MEEHRPVLLHDTGAFDPKGSGPKLYERLVR
jgi:hypothetical protein